MHSCNFVSGFELANCARLCLPSYFLLKFKLKSLVAFLIVFELKSTGTTTNRLTSQTLLPSDRSSLSKRPFLQYSGAWRADQEVCRPKASLGHRVTSGPVSLGYKIRLRQQKRLPSL